MKKLRVNHGTVAAYLALFVALGGGAYAATRLPKNSVGTAQLKKHAVTLSKIAGSAQRSLRGQAGRVGPRGAAGPGAVALVRENVLVDEKSPDTGPPLHQLTKAGPYAIAYACYVDYTLSSEPYAELFVKGPAGTYQASGLRSVNDASPTPYTGGGYIGSGQETNVAHLEGPGPQRYSRMSGTVIVTAQSGSGLTIQFSILQDQRARNTCAFYGSAFPSS